MVEGKDMQKTEDVRAKIFRHVIDSMDIETTFVCKDEAEARTLAIQMMHSFGFKEADVVLLEQKGQMARLRIRGYVHKPGDRYGWLEI